MSHCQSCADLERQLASERSRREGAERELLAAHHALDRWVTGKQIEGDYVSPFDPMVTREPAPGGTK